MFDAGVSELMVIGVVALVVIGPERLPRVARTVGALVGRAQRYFADVKADVDRELQLEDLKRLQAEMADRTRQIEKTLSGEIRQVQQSVEGEAAKLQSAVAAEEPPKPTAG